MLSRFRLKGIEYPGKVDIYKRGQVVLAELDDDTAEQLWKEGIPYLEPTPEGRKILFPGEAPIVVKPVRKSKSGL